MRSGEYKHHTAHRERGGRERERERELGASMCSGERWEEDSLLIGLAAEETRQQSHRFLQYVGT